jgi:hypothetical protein
MKATISFVAKLPLVVLILFACSEIDSSNLKKERFFEQHATCPITDIKVTLNEAIAVADKFVNGNAGSELLPTKSAGSSSKLIKSSETIREEGQNLMYVFNYEDGGFVIVGSTRNYYPILAYSDKGSFVLQDDMGPVDVWLDETKVGIKNSASLNDETKAQMHQLWARYDGSCVDPAQELLAVRRPQTRSTGEDYCWDRIDSLQAEHGSEGWTYLPLSFVEDLFSDLGLDSYYDAICYSANQNHSALNETIIGYRNPVHYIVEPLIGTEWFQWGFFGSLCPNSFAGCGAVAAGQLMRYYEYPPTLSWGGETFTWAYVPKVHNSAYTWQKHPALMRMLGQKFQMEYRPDGSSATTTSKIVNGLDSLGYDAYSANYDTWSVRNELSVYRRPVIMFGSETTSPDDDGHFWVSEGVHEIIYDAIQFYTENQPYGVGSFTQGMYTYNNPGVEGGSIFFHYFYMNWGWNTSISNYNGWFASYDVDSGQGNLQYQRTNIYVSVP